uniref:Lysosome-associated membrane glycoprotein 5 n=1 Tax=Saccoglossus kowalevskii TaxID=10224 RepID=A0ABM0M173_SACKO|nr:PREDICTED: lysosome-associated membrane glycoprotein 1-like [Saccoglossus kowalevskii]
MPPSASSSDSECAGNTSSSTLKLDFFTDWFVEMKFVLGSSVDTLDDDKYYMNSFTLQYVLDDNFKNPAKPGTTMSATRTNNDFGTTIGKSYECESKTDLTINDDVEMDISDLRIQPFAERSDGEYGESESCTMDTVNDNLIAIIVGCCLAGLIIIVVIGYCVGRYRKKSYTSI